jgi:hypothetical protein
MQRKAVRRLLVPRGCDQNQDEARGQSDATLFERLALVLERIASRGL